MKTVLVGCSCHLGCKYGGHEVLGQAPPAQGLVQNILHIFQHKSWMNKSSKIAKTLPVTL